MDINSVIAAVGRMFPSANLSGAVEQAKKAIAGTPDSLDGARATASRLGIDRQFIESIYNRFGNTMQGRAVCGLLGTTPEALKADADKLLGGGGSPLTVPRGASESVQRFPRLK